MTIRLTKIALMASVSLLLLLVVFNNITDYATNFQFVSHVLSMDTTLRHASVMWRSIERPLVHHLAYLLLIGWEILAAGLCLAGTLKLAAAFRAEPPRFAAATDVAVLGLAASLVLWLAGFIAMGGEWFLMWQSSTWNGQAAASRMFGIHALVLLFMTSAPDRLAPR